MIRCCKTCCGFVFEIQIFLQTTTARYGTVRCNPEEHSNCTVLYRTARYRYGTVRCRTVRYGNKVNEILYHTVPYRTVRYGTIGTVRYRYGTVRSFQ